MAPSNTTADQKTKQAAAAAAGGNNNNNSNSNDGNNKGLRRNKTSSTRLNRDVRIPPITESDTEDVHNLNVVTEDAHGSPTRNNGEPSPTTSSSQDDQDENNQLTVTSLSGKPLISSVEKKGSRGYYNAKAQRRKREQEEWVAARRRFKAPDAGYSWMVAFGSFMVQFWVAGLIKSFGMLYVEVLEAFPGSSAATASWIPAILSNLCLSLAPVASALCQRYTCRSVVMVGGILCCVGLTLSFFATNLLFLCLTFGALTGIGAGLSTTPGIVMVARYFDKRRAFANGICVSGTAAGGLIIPWLMEYLIDTFGFRGAILVFGALVSHVCVAAAIYRPPSIHQFIMEKEERRKTKRPVFFAGNTAINGNGHLDINTGSDINLEKERLSLPTINFPNFQRSVSEEPSVDRPRIPAQTSCISLMQYYEHRLEVPPSSDAASVNIPMVESETKVATNTNVLQIRKNTSFMHSVEDVFTDSTCVYKDKLPEDPNAVDVKKEEERRTRSSCACCTRYLDFSLLKSPVFLLLCLSVMLMAAGCPYALFYVPVFVTENGYSKMDATFLVSVNAILDLIGRLGYGYVVDLNLFKKRNGYIASVLVAGISILLFPYVLTQSWIGAVVLVSTYGLGLGSWFLLIPVLLADHHGTDKIASSYGLLRVFQGVMALAVPPFAGTLKDVTGEYTICFYFMGTSMVLGGLLMFLLPCAIRYEEQRKKTLL